MPGMTGAMRVTTRLLSGLVLAAAVIMLPGAQALACSCGMGTPAEMFEHADVVFVGTAADVSQPRPGGMLGPTVDYLFHLGELRKGPVPGFEVLVNTSSDEASCGTSFTLGKDWLVFASLQQGVLSTGLCSGNVAVADEAGQAALAELPPPIPLPAAAEEAAPGAAGLSLPPVGVTLGGAAVVLLITFSTLAFLRGGRGARG